MKQPIYKTTIHETLQRLNFQFHRRCSFTELFQGCDAGEGQTVLMYWSPEHSGSMSVSVSTCSSRHRLSTTPLIEHCERELRSIEQQTVITCRVSSGLSSTESLVFPAPLQPPPGRSTSILGSVCALLLNNQNQGSALAPKQVSSVASENICRICFGGESAERLVRPCSCRGTVAAVHRSCLERWLLQASTSYCELCRHHYVVTRSHKWSWLRSLVEWARSGRGRALAADAWRGAALGAGSLLGTARALAAADRLLQAGARAGGGSALAANLVSSLLIGVIGALNGLLTTWLLLKVQEHQGSWRAWRDSTLHVRVRLRGDSDPAVGPGDGGRGPGDGGGAGGVDRGTDVADPFMMYPDP
ncbi:unnamed protein product [Plutella xylostella]|uniref:(diamondback moth) hypothetical protein n=1 Tax=Plutella xylostella TaxID=51655 RepID=A0A8S4G856_PLUXY|nr:unnamed protein product [Plutella xylostella]